MERLSIFENRLIESVRVGEILVSPTELQSCLNRFVRNLVNYDVEMEGNEIQLIGSASGLAMGGRRFFLGTKHQLNGVHPKNVSILVPGSDVCLTTAGYADFSSKSSDDDVYDLCAFVFVPQSYQTPHLTGCFSNLHRLTFGIQLTTSSHSL